MSLREQLVQPTAKQSEYTPKTEFDGRSGFIQTGPLEAAPKSHTEILELFGYNTDEVRIVGAPRVSRWQTYDERWLAAYRFHLEPVHDSRVDDLLASIKRFKAHKPVGAGSAVFNFQAGDQQFGKVDNGGSEGIVDRYLQSVEGAVQEFKSLRRRRNIGVINLMFPGDCIEGNQSQNGRSFWRTDLTVTEQVRVFRRLLLHTIQVGSSRVDLQACKLEYSIVSPK